MRSDDPARDYNEYDSLRERIYSVSIAGKTCMDCCRAVASDMYPEAWCKEVEGFVTADDTPKTTECGAFI